MHESNFTKQIVGAILDELAKYPEARPRAVKVRVGEMLHLAPESVRLHYGFLTKDTPLEGISLELAEMPVRVNCQACGREGGVKDHHVLLCPVCGSAHVKLVSGDGVWIDSIEVESKG